MCYRGQNLSRCTPGDLCFGKSPRRVAPTRDGRAGTVNRPADRSRLRSNEVADTVAPVIRRIGGTAVREVASAESARQRSDDREGIDDGRRGRSIKNRVFLAPARHGPDAAPAPAPAMRNRRCRTTVFENGPDTPPCGHCRPRTDSHRQTLRCRPHHQIPCARRHRAVSFTNRAINQHLAGVVNIRRRMHRFSRGVRAIRDAPE